MANNQDALDAIQDLKESIAEYGSTITIREATQIDPNDYDPLTYTGSTFTDTETKGIVKSVSSNEMLNNIVDTYELSVILSPTIEITTKTRFIYDGKGYKITDKGIDKTILQDTTVMYECLLVGHNE